LKKSIVFAGIAIVAAAKFIIMKYLIFDQPSYEKCLSGASMPGTITGQLLSLCGSDPVMNLVIGWIAVGVRGAILILGLRADSIPKSKYV